jgi:hypothetical protein
MPLCTIQLFLCISACFLENNYTRSKNETYVWYGTLKKFSGYLIVSVQYCFFYFFNTVYKVVLVDSLVSKMQKKHRLANVCHRRNGLCLRPNLGHYSPPPPPPSPYVVCYRRREPIVKNLLRLFTEPRLVQSEVGCRSGGEAPLCP